MCGRFALYSSHEKIAQYFSATMNYHFDASYNIAPTRIIPVLIAVNGERFIVPMRWGLIPSWHRAGQKLALLNNAKVETIDTKPSFRTSFKRRRCVIIADGFYEWSSASTPKQPFYFHAKDNHPIALGGIWDKWETDGKSVESCCIITEPANKLVGQVHDRMPVIIAQENMHTWLDTSLQDVFLIKQSIENNSSYNDMTSYPVTPKMNRSNFDGIECIRKL